MLVSRPDGREALMAFQPTLNEIKNGEGIEIDFDGVDVLSPSWADEFVTPLQERYKGRIKYKNTDNSSVKATLEFLEEINKE